MNRTEVTTPAEEGRKEVKEDEENERAEEDEDEGKDGDGDGNGNGESEEAIRSREGSYLVQV